ncbi:hypothetical protein NQ315_002413 [Exocentrus adspersus]|uniref:Acidic fibroblast growth factor intracellular-binding protein n=1 Tax=Exocentrus adspersus TaxID=1586481 RepID=A0AAV8VTB9_9CUCU|nr:hypothetical protein NQ315_002413 [Exocentrus adspersus]
MNMTQESLFISKYTCIDPEIFELWVEGYTASEAIAIISFKELSMNTGVTLEEIEDDLRCHYGMYSHLEKTISNPKLDGQLRQLFQADPPTRLWVLEKYYQIDDAVIRELLCKELISDDVKNFSEVAEKTGKSCKSCRRQFDNIRRVFEAVREMSGSILENIKILFHLRDELAKKYACLVSLCCMGFKTPEKLNYLTFDSWKKCCEVIIEQWTYKLTGPEYHETKMDKEFLLKLTEFKMLIDGEEDHKRLICLYLKPKLSQKDFSDLDSNFHLYTGAILTLAIALHCPENIKNLFIDLKQILEYFKQNNWSIFDLGLFLQAYDQCAIEVDVIKIDATLKSTWGRFMEVLSRCLLSMY